MTFLASQIVEKPTSCRRWLQLGQFLQQKRKPAGVLSPYNALLVIIISSSLTHSSDSIGSGWSCDSKVCAG